MAYSSILGAENAPEQPEGRDSRALGPSNNSDSGSDTIGTHEAYADSDAVGTGERGGVSPGDGREGGDILPDHVVELTAQEQALAEQADLGDVDDLTDLDANDVEADIDQESGRS
jgi:hypothetical protein